MCELSFSPLTALIMPKYPFQDKNWYTWK